MLQVLKDIESVYPLVKNIFLNWHFLKFSLYLPFLLTCIIMFKTTIFFLRLNIIVIIIIIIIILTYFPSCIALKPVLTIKQFLLTLPHLTLLPYRMISDRQSSPPFAFWILHSLAAAAGTNSRMSHPDYLQQGLKLELRV